MSILSMDSIKVKILFINARHLPQDEYNRLDLFMDYPNVYGLQASIYSSGIVIYIANFNREYVFNANFPVLSEILLKADEDNIKIIDFYESNLHKIPGLKIYHWVD